VFTDVNMPGRLDGFQLARIVQDYYHGTGVIVATGKVVPAPGDISADAMFLAKPYRAENLVRAVHVGASPAL
jgi:DNA-binding LytR/AlgR family response regulator